MVIEVIFTKESPRQNRRDYLRQCVKLRLEAVRVFQETSLRLQNAPNVIGTINGNGKGSFFGNFKEYIGSISSQGSDQSNSEITMYVTS